MPSMSTGVAAKMPVRKVKSATKSAGTRKIPILVGVSFLLGGVAGGCGMRWGAERWEVLRGVGVMKGKWWVAV